MYTKCTLSSLAYQYVANPKLGKWVMTQRYNCKLYQERKPCSMAAERIQELEKAHNGSWNERFEQLRVTPSTKY